MCVGDFCVSADLNSPLLFGRLNGLSSDSTIDILYQMGTTQDSGTKDRYVMYRRRSTYFPRADIQVSSHSAYYFLCQVFASVN